MVQPNNTVHALGGPDNETMLWNNYIVGIVEGVVNHVLLSALNSLKPLFFNYCIKMQIPFSLRLSCALCCFNGGHFGSV